MTTFHELKQQLAEARATVRLQVQLADRARFEAQAADAERDAANAARSVAREMEAQAQEHVEQLRERLRVQAAAAMFWRAVCVIQSVVLIATAVLCWGS